MGNHNLQTVGIGDGLQFFRRQGSFDARGLDGGVADLADLLQRRIQFLCGIGVIAQGVHLGAQNFAYGDRLLFGRDYDEISTANLRTKLPKPWRLCSQKRVLISS
ncbi:hypothetical protein D3C75_1194990 [compost metagenome]